MRAQGVGRTVLLISTSTLGKYSSEIGSPVYPMLIDLMKTDRVAIRHFVDISVDEWPNLKVRRCLSL